MKSLETLATNVFNAPLESASRPNVVFFSDDTIGRFDADNPGGIYTPNLNLFKNSVTNYKTAVTDAQTGQRQGATATVDETFTLFKNTGRQLYSAIENGFGIKTSHLLVFFPQGLNGINRAKRGDVDTIVSNWLKMVIKHPYVDVLKKEWEDKLTDLQTNWRTSMGVQSGAKGDVSKGGSDAESFLTPMAQHLWNLLLQVIQNNQPNAQHVIRNYFDTTPLNRNQSADTDGLGRTFGIAKDLADVGLPAVHVTLKDAAQQIIWAGKTDGEGKWRTKSVSVGMYLVTFEKPGYVTQTFSHEIVDNGDSAVDVMMLVG